MTSPSHEIHENRSLLTPPGLISFTHSAPLGQLQAREFTKGASSSVATKVKRAGACFFTGCKQALLSKYVWACLLSGTGVALIVDSLSHERSLEFLIGCSGIILGGAVVSLCPNNEPVLP